MKLPLWPNPIGYRDIDLGLSRVNHLLERLDNPHLKLPTTIHLAGTNGKGSTLAYLKSIFEASGLKVHGYISPHLVRFNERIILAGKEISDDFLNQILKECRKATEIEPKINVTFFEGVTVAAFLAFSKIKADVLLLETGMGGRLDATNVITNPLLTIITTISLDHTDFLGTTLSKIALEKAGIIKKYSTTIISKQKSAALKVLKTSAQKNNSSILAYGEHWKSSKTRDGILFEYGKQKLLLPSPSLMGHHQIINAGNAVMAVLAQKQFKINHKNIASGLQNAVWPARLQKITQGKFYKLIGKNTDLILDGSHNEDGAKTLKDWLKKDRLAKNYLINAMLKDKDTENFLKHLATETELLMGLEIKNDSKSKTAAEIVAIARSLKIKAANADDFSDAIKKINHYHLKNYPYQPSRIVVCGSLYLAGQFLEENG